ncbi:MAG: ABC-F family ATP-binding cassette domain-containing protein [Coprococcus sp.]
MNLLTMKEFSKAYTDKILFDCTDFSVNSGEKIGIIGINGTGKSTLLKLISGIDECDKGQVIKGSNIVIKYLPQMPDFSDNKTIYDYVVTANSTEYNKWTIEGDAKSLLNRLGFNDINISTGTLSGGQKKKVALAAALLSPCDILVLDEPTNHLDNDMTEYLENYLNNYKGALVMVTHDRYFLDRVCNKIVEIDKGKIYSYNENYEGYLTLKAERENIALATERKHQNILRKEIAWIRRGARARSTKQKAHIKRYEALAAEELIKADQSVNMNSISSRLGNKTIEIHDINKAWDTNPPVIADFSYNFLRTDRIGITGPNGCGKSTLMKLITGITKPDSGYIEIGDTVRIGYFSQENEALDENMRVIDYVKETAEFIKTTDGYISAASMCEQFLFNSTLQYQKIGKLSGGEKRRLYLLKVLVSSPNVLILDEPTNDLDISTLCILEDYLDNFQGILIAVSHDRYFLDRVARKLFVFDGNGHISQFEGSYTDYYLQYGSFANSSNSSFQSEPVKSKPEASKAIAPKTSVKKKFSFKEQREYDTIESDIEKIETELDVIDTAIEESATDFAKLNRLMEEKAQLEERLDYLMERYIYLTDLAEQFANQQM